MSLGVIQLLVAGYNLYRRKYMLRAYTCVFLLFKEGKVGKTSFSIFLYAYRLHLFSSVLYNIVKDSQSQ